MLKTYDLTVERDGAVVGFGEHYTEELLIHNIRRIIERTAAPYKIVINVVPLDDADAV